MRLHRRVVLVLDSLEGWWGLYLPSLCRYTSLARPYIQQTHLRALVVLVLVLGSLMLELLLLVEPAPPVLVLVLVAAMAGMAPVVDRSNQC
jgi:hypothetical protein